MAQKNVTQISLSCPRLNVGPDPRYCDVIIKRWQDFSGKAATLEGDGRTFDEIAGGRMAEAA